MSHWKTGVKILCSKSWEGQNSMKAKIWGSKFYFFLVEPLVKILCSLKRGVKILYFFPVPWKRGVKTAEPTNQLHWRGAPPGPLYIETGPWRRCWRADVTEANDINVSVLSARRRFNQSGSVQCLTHGSRIKQKIRKVLLYSKGMRVIAVDPESVDQAELVW